MTDLDKLIDAIECGDDKGVKDCAVALARKARDVSDYFPCYEIIKAYEGSLNAAKALQGELLPGWAWEVGVNATFVSIGQVWKSGTGGVFCCC